jgi:S1-C subfamily serine protease
MPAREAKRDGAYKTVQATQRFTDGERETVRLFNNAKASVVYITNVAVRRDAFTLDLTEQPQGAGSGIVWDDKGHIVTNYHVIDKANQLKVSFLPNKGGVQNQKTYDAASVSSRSGTRLGSITRSQPASSAASDERFKAVTPGAQSTASFKRTRRSIPATRGALC